MYGSGFQAAGGRQKRHSRAGRAFFGRLFRKNTDSCSPFLGEKTMPVEIFYRAEEKMRRLKEKLQFVNKSLLTYGDKTVTI